MRRISTVINQFFTAWGLLRNLNDMGKTQRDYLSRSGKYHRSSRTRL